MVHFNCIVNYISLLTFMTTNTIQISYYRFITSPANSNSNINIFLSTTNTTTTIISHSDYWQPPNWSPALFCPVPLPSVLHIADRRACKCIHMKKKTNSYDLVLTYFPHIILHKLLLMLCLSEPRAGLQPQSPAHASSTLCPQSSLLLSI